jgi:endonuclease III
VSVALSPIQAPHRLRSQDSGFAGICRARKIVATLGGRFSLELGLDLDRDPEDVERWALAATLLGNRISTAVAMRTYRVLERAGVRTIEDAGRRHREDLVALLHEGGYLRYDELEASRLLALAQVIADRYHGRLATLAEEIADSEELERALRALPGWAPVTVRAFLRELRGVWPGAHPPLDTRSATAALHLKLPAGSHALVSLAAAAQLDFRDLEAGLVRLCLCHDLRGCPGGEECPFAALDRDQFVHF